MARSAAALEIAFDDRAVARPGRRGRRARWHAPRRGGGEAAAHPRPADGEPTGYVAIGPLPADYAAAAPRRAARRHADRAATGRRVRRRAVVARRGQDAVLRGEHGRAARGRPARRRRRDVRQHRRPACSRRRPARSSGSVGRTLHTTPTGATGILAGTTQQLLFERARGGRVADRETLGTVDDLHAADVVCGWSAASAGRSTSSSSTATSASAPPERRRRDPAPRRLLIGRSASNVSRIAERARIASYRGRTRERGWSEVEYLSDA